MPHLALLLKISTAWPGEFSLGDLTCGQAHLYVTMYCHCLRRYTREMSAEFRRTLLVLWCTYIYFLQSYRVFSLLVGTGYIDLYRIYYFCWDNARVTIIATPSVGLQSHAISTGCWGWASDTVVPRWRLNASYRSTHARSHGSNILMFWLAQPISGFWCFAD